MQHVWMGFKQGFGRWLFYGLVGFIALGCSFTLLFEQLPEGVRIPLQPVFDWLVGSQTINNTLLLGIYALSLYGVFELSRKVYFHFFPQSTGRFIDQSDYVQDMFGELLVTWEWSANQPVNFTVICPTCSLELVEFCTNPATGAHSAHCENCGEWFRTKYENETAMALYCQAFVKQAIRTGAYKERVLAMERLQAG